MTLTLMQNKVFISNYMFATYSVIVVRILYLFSVTIIYYFNDKNMLKN